MSAYVVVCVTWNDQEAAAKYGAIVKESLKPFGGRWLARGPVDSSLKAVQLLNAWRLLNSRRLTRQDAGMSPMRISRPSQYEPHQQSHIG